VLDLPNPLRDAAPADAQTAMEKARTSSPHLQKFASVREALAGYNSMFMSSRYLFEPSSDLSTFVIEEISELLDEQLGKRLRGHVAPPFCSCCSIHATNAVSLIRIVLPIRMCFGPAPWWINS
jgi:hypothetical protein